MTKRRSYNPESSELTEKKLRGTPKVFKTKFSDEKKSKVINIEPKTLNQSKYLELLKTKQLVFAVGSSGAGKTYIACLHAVNEYLKGSTEKIILIRPYEFVGRSIGLRPGTGIEKLTPTMQSMLEPIRNALGEGEFEYALEHEKIILESLEDCRGRSYKNATIVIDECSNTDIKSMQTLVTRLDEGSQMIMCGDSAPWQQDIKGTSGLNWVLGTLAELRKSKPTYLDEEDYDNLYNNIGIVNFTREDVVRSGLTRMFVKVFDEVKLV